MSKRVAVTTTCSTSASLGEGVGEACWAKQAVERKARITANWIGERARLAFWRARPAMADFSRVLGDSEILGLKKDRFGATPLRLRSGQASPARGTPALP